jgi:uncharacterized protein YjbJ (UPF0337 family)
MSSFIERAKDKAQDLAEQAKPFIGKAKDQAEDLAEKAKPLADKAMGKAGEVVEKARPMAASAVDRMGEGLDKVTGGRYTGKIDGVSDKVEGALRGTPKTAEPTPGPQATDIHTPEIVDAEVVEEPAPGDGPGA